MSISKKFNKRLRIVKKAALKYKRRGHFQLRDRNNYTWAVLHGVLDKVCAHMPGKYQDIKWTMTALKKAALRYKRRGDFQKKSPVAYHAAYQKGLLDAICMHMPKPNTWVDKKLKEEKILKTALQYPFLSDFVREHMGAYYASKRHGFYLELKRKHKEYYNDTSDRGLAC